MSQLSEMERILTASLKHEQDLSITLNERIMELEQEIKALSATNELLESRLNAKYAAEVDDA